MAKVNSNKQSAKRFLRNNGAIIATVLLFVVILSTLLIARYGSLYSIKDIANINPLITTENTELIAVNVNGVIKIIKDNDGSANDSDEKTESPTSNTIASNQQPGTTVTNPTGGASGSTPKPSSTPSSPSPSASPGPIISLPPILSPSPTPSPSEFRVTIQSKGRTDQDIDDFRFPWLSCENTHTLQIRAKATSGAGSANVEWKFNDEVVKTDKKSLENMKNGDTRTSEATVTTESFGVYSIAVDIVNVNGTKLASTDITFSHTCI